MIQDASELKQQFNTALHAGTIIKSIKIMLLVLKSS